MIVLLCTLSLEFLNVIAVHFFFFYNFVILIVLKTISF